MAVLNDRGPDPLQDFEGYLERGVKSAVVIGSPAYPPTPEETKARLKADFERSYSPAGFTRQYAAAAASLEATARLRRALFSHATRIGLVATKPQASAEVAALFTDKAGALEDGFRAALTSAWRGPVTAVLLVALVLAVNFWLGVAFL